MDTSVACRNLYYCLSFVQRAGYYTCLILVEIESIKAGGWNKSPKTYEMGWDRIKYFCNQVVHEIWPARLKSVCEQPPPSLQNQKRLRNCFWIFTLARRKEKNSSNLEFKNSLLLPMIIFNPAMTYWKMRGSNYSRKRCAKIWPSLLVQPAPWESPSCSCLLW